MEKSERERKRENGIKKSFFRALLSSHLVPSGPWVVAEWWRDRRMKGGRDGGGCDDRLPHIAVNKEKDSSPSGHNGFISSSGTTAAPRPYTCPSTSVCLPRHGVILTIQPFPLDKGMPKYGPTKRGQSLTWWVCGGLRDTQMEKKGKPGRRSCWRQRSYVTPPGSTQNFLACLLQPWGAMRSWATRDRGQGWGRVKERGEESLGYFNKRE